MQTIVKISAELLSQARLYSAKKTKKEITEEALELFIMLNRQSGIKNMRGKLKWVGDLEQMREN